MTANQRAWPRSFALLCVLSLVLGVTLLTGDQVRAAHGATAHVYNPMSLSNTVGSTYAGHPVYYFSGWTNRFAIDINSPDESPDAPIWLWGDGSPLWSTASVLTGANAPISWTVFANNTGPCLSVGTEFAMAMALNLSNGQTAGTSISHLSNYHYAAGATVSRGAQTANLSWLSNGRTTYSNGSCSTLNSTAPHVHVESARTGTTTLNSWDSASGPSWRPYWYYNY